MVLSACTLAHKKRASGTRPLMGTELGTSGSAVNALYHRATSSALITVFL